MAREAFISTTDNPWNPFTHFNDWLKWDDDHDYRTFWTFCRLCPTSDVYTEAVDEEMANQVIDDMVKTNLVGMETGYKVNHIKVFWPPND